MNKAWTTIAELASQLTLEQQCNASIDAQDYYRECICDGMGPEEAQRKAEQHQIKALRAMVNDKTLSICI